MEKMLKILAKNGEMLSNISKGVEHTPVKFPKLSEVITEKGVSAKAPIRSVLKEMDAIKSVGTDRRALGKDIPKMVIKVPGVEDKLMLNDYDKMISKDGFLVVGGWTYTLNPIVIRKKGGGFKPLSFYDMLMLMLKGLGDAVAYMDAADLERELNVTLLMGGAKWRSKYGMLYKFPVERLKFGVDELAPYAKMIMRGKFTLDFNERQIDELIKGQKDYNRIMCPYPAKHEGKLDQGYLKSKYQLVFGGRKIKVTKGLEDSGLKEYSLYAISQGLRDGGRTSPGTPRSTEGVKCHTNKADYSFSVAGMKFKGATYCISPDLEDMRKIGYDPQMEHVIGPFEFSTIPKKLDLKYKTKYMLRPRDIKIKDTAGMEFDGNFIIGPFDEKSSNGKLARETSFMKEGKDAKFKDFISAPKKMESVSLTITLDGKTIDTKAHVYIIHIYEQRGKRPSEMKTEGNAYRNVCGLGEVHRMFQDDQMLED